MFFILQVYYRCKLGYLTIYGCNESICIIILQYFLSKNHFSWKLGFMLISLFQQNIENLDSTARWEFIPISP